MKVSPFVITLLKPLLFYSIFKFYGNKLILNNLCKNLLFFFQLVNPEIEFKLFFNVFWFQIINSFFVNPRLIAIKLKKILNCWELIKLGYDFYQWTF